MNIHFYCAELLMLVKSLEQVDELVLANFEFVEVSEVVAIELLNNNSAIINNTDLKVFEEIYPVEYLIIQI